jgi:hypothetical protein
MIMDSEEDAMPELIPLGSPLQRSAAGGITIVPSASQLLVGKDASEAGQRGIYQSIDKGQMAMNRALLGEKKKLDRNENRSVGEEKNGQETGAVPVTIITGYLGSGKTTVSSGPATMQQTAACSISVSISLTGAFCA